MVGSTKMQPLVAHVRNGRLLLDEPTDLPEGELVALSPLDGLVAVAVADDDLDPAERDQLHRALEASIAEADQGCTEDFSKLLAKLRRRA